MSDIGLREIVSLFLLDSIPFASSISEVPAHFNSTSTVCLAACDRLSKCKHQSAKLLKLIGWFACGSGIVNFYSSLVKCHSGSPSVRQSVSPSGVSTPGGLCGNEKSSSLHAKLRWIDIPIYPTNCFFSRSHIRRHSQSVNVSRTRTSHF